MKSASLRWILPVFAIAATSAVSAGTPALALTSASFMEVDGQPKSAKGHPNEEWRFTGLKAYLSGQHAEAIRSFERAAGYADKYSQHYLSLIYWHGQGVPVDRVRAYIYDVRRETKGPQIFLSRAKPEFMARLFAQEVCQYTLSGAVSRAACSWENT